MTDVLSRIRQQLNLMSDEKLKAGSLRFFKEEIRVYGTKTDAVIKLAKEYFREVKPLGKEAVLLLCEDLWQSGYMEESFIASHWAEALGKEYLPSDFDTLSRWVHQYVSNWASCDTLCNHTVGDFVMKYPATIEQLKQWTQSENRWVRRASAVSLIIPARKGLFLNDIFDIASLLLLDTDDLVQKGYGWMLKAASQAHLNEVYGFVAKNKAVMPRTALRYAIEKMPAEMKAEAMKKA